MRLIDILNLIAKGELKEETQMRIGCVNFFYRNGILENGKGYPLFTSGYLSKSTLLQDVEITDHIGEPDKKVEKIEEIRMDIFNCEALDCENEILRLADKLNEVIRELNRRSE